MQQSVLLDSSVILAYFKNNLTAIDLIQNSNELFCSSVSVFEVMCGEQYLLYKGFDSKIKQIGDFFNHINVIPVDCENSLKASEIYGLLKIKGLKINNFDLLILALAITKNISLVTYDFDFEIIRDIVKQIYNYDKLIFLK